MKFWESVNSHLSLLTMNSMVVACECERGNIYVDFVPSEKVIELAKKENMSIALAGGKWKEIGRMGFGELVKPEDAIILISKLKRKFGD